MDKALRVWDLESMTQKACLEGDGGPINSVAISKDGKTAVSGGMDKTLSVWDLGSMTQKACLEGNIGWAWSVAISGDGKTAVSSCMDSLQVWDLES
ncbi:hypothetical protein GUITHDRAFT_55239, partial [Guillardia theta CCMP2712]